jgi:hypothetical protein
MKKTFCFLLLLLPVCGFSQSVLGKFKQKVKDRIEQRTDEGMDKAGKLYYYTCRRKRTGLRVPV